MLADACYTFYSRRCHWHLGVETSPSDICSKYEIHVTGDAGLAILNYLYMTNDTQGLANDRLVQMSKDIADFFTGRLVYNQAQDRYEIPGNKN
jgi:trehalose/maltose hydrolase-like predicted phosphorylase